MSEEQTNLNLNLSKTSAQPNMAPKEDENLEEVFDTAVDDEEDEEDKDVDTGSIDSRQSGKRSDSFGSMSFGDIINLLNFTELDFGFDPGTKRKFKEMKSKTEKKLRQFREDAKFKDANKELLRLNEKLLSGMELLDQRIHNRLDSSAIEKLFYAVSLFSIVVAGFIIGKYPEWFHIYYTFLFTVLMPIRFYTYFKQYLQFFLADICYYVNVLLIAFIWAFPGSVSLFISVFSLAMGTLSFAVITWRNSLVLHLIDKTTSSFIHIMPPVSLFVIVHELPKDYLMERFPAVAQIDRWDFFSCIFWTCVYYVLWQACYHYFITFKRQDQIEQGKVTSFTWLKKKRKNTTLGKLVTSLPYTWMQVAAFSFLQFGYQLLAMMLCPIWYNSKHACGTFMVFIFIWASYNGATYYIDVFGNRLESEVEKLQAEVFELEKKNSYQSSLESSAEKIEE